MSHLHGNTRKHQAADTASRIYLCFHLNPRVRPSIFTWHVDDLDVRELMDNPNNGKYDTSRGVSVVLANALLGDPGTTVRLGECPAMESTVWL